MSEQKHDNLQGTNSQADGNNEAANKPSDETAASASIEATATQAPEVDDAAELKDNSSFEVPSEVTVAADSLQPEELDSEFQSITEQSENLPAADNELHTNTGYADVNNEPEIATIESDNLVNLTDEQIADDKLVIEDNSALVADEALDAISDSNAADSEDETLKGRHDIPMEDYDNMSMEELTAELAKLVAVENVMSVKDHVENIRHAFFSKYNHFIEQKKDEFTAQNPDSTEDFSYQFPLKMTFDNLYNQYRDKKNTHFKSLQTNLKSNLEERLAIVEELKELINPQENIKDTLKHFNELRERWKNAGPIPKDKYNHVWNNYHFHVENFYDYLHLDREARDIDFKHNLEQKQKIISRVEELVNEADVNKAFRELQDLHKIWKEDIGPVSRDHREEIWNRFSDLTRQMHDKREQLFGHLRASEQENLAKKKEIIAQIEQLATEKVSAHSQWQGQIDKVEALRTQFFNTGKVPGDVNEATWAAFKTAVRNFNSFKNSFYKDIKKDQQENLNKKMALVAKAIELQSSEDFAATTPVMKQIQEEWKQIGHVPRKYSDKIWKEFKDACNHYFEKLKLQKNEGSEEESQAFENKKTYLDTLRQFEMTGDHKTDLDAIKAHIENWKGFGRVPFARRHIEGKFNKILDALFEKLSLSKKDSDMTRFTNRLDHMAGNDDGRRLDNEKVFLMRKIDEVQSEIFQLENNIQFFTNTKNAKKENSIVLEVRRNIEKHKEELGVLREKLKQIRNIKQE